MTRRVAALLLSIVGAACSAEAPVDARSVVLITLDTTRCDALDSFGGTRGVAPRLDQLARESVRYVEARTVTPLTLPAHASMFTGLYPPRLGVRANGPAMLPEEAETVAERALARGFQTAAFVGGLSLDRAYGPAQGFQTWTQPADSPTRALGAISDRPANEVVAEALAWLAVRDRARPFFLWVHVFDAHGPYVAPTEYLERADGQPYYAEVAHLDAQLGQLFDALAAESYFERGLLCVVADHGEALGEHGEDTHGQHLWDSTLRVPFFVRYPDRARANEESQEVVSVADVGPTLLEAMGLDVPPGIDGVSLYKKRAPTGRGTYFESLAGWARFRWSPMCGWIDAQHKYVHSSESWLVAPRSDPGETTLLEDRAAVELARASIQRVLAAPRLESRALAATETRGVAVLGYGDSGEFEPEYPDPLAPTELPSPDARLDEYRAFTAAQTLVQLRRYSEAVPKLEQLLRDNPQSVHALDELAIALVELEDWPRALDVLRRRAELQPDRLSLHRNLVKCYLALGEAEQARRHTLRALELLIEAHERRGEHELATGYRRIYANEVSSGGK
jgi:arylsulfatase A-like enzyme